MGGCFNSKNQQKSLSPKVDKTSNIPPHRFHPPPQQILQPNPTVPSAVPTQLNTSYNPYPTVSYVPPSDLNISNVMRRQQQEIMYRLDHPIESKIKVTNIETPNSVIPTIHAAREDPVHQLLEKIAEPAPASDPSITGTVRQMPSNKGSQVLESGKQKGNSIIAFRPRSGLIEQEKIPEVKLPVVHEESEIVNDENAVNNAIPISNLKLDVKVN